MTSSIYERLIGLIGPGRLFGTRGDIGHDLGHGLDGFNDLAQCRAGAVHQVDAVLDLAVAVRDPGP